MNGYLNEAYARKAAKRAFRWVRNQGSVGGAEPPGHVGPKLDVLRVLQARSRRSRDKTRAPA